MARGEGKEGERGRRGEHEETRESRRKAHERSTHNEQPLDTRRSQLWKRREREERKGGRRGDLRQQ